MSFDLAKDEARERFTETLSLLNEIRQNDPRDFKPLDPIQRTLRGLWLVLLYSAFERSVNAIVEAALDTVAAEAARSVDHMPQIQSIIHYNRIKSLKDTGWSGIIDKSKQLFVAAFSNDQITSFGNPLSDKLQNVDGSTLIWLSELFCLKNFVITPSDRGRLNNLKERRNAVAHGRESAFQVGQRFKVDELARLYEVADRVSTDFCFIMKDSCEKKAFLRVA